jgi:hypothetical protein
MTEQCSLSTSPRMILLFGKSLSLLLMVMPLPQLPSMFPLPLYGWHKLFGELLHGRFELAFTIFD